MTEIPQYGICCLVTTKLKVRFKNYFALGCSCLPFGLCVKRSLRFNNTWPALCQKHLETQPGRSLYTKSKVSQSRVYVTHTHRAVQVWIVNWLGWIPQIIACVIPGCGASLTFPHSSILMKHKSPRALHSRPCAAGGWPAPLMGTVELPGWKRVGGCPRHAEVAGFSLAGAPGIPLQRARSLGRQMN